MCGDIPLKYLDRLLAAFDGKSAEEGGASESEAKPVNELVEALSDRELEILTILANGLTNKEIAEIQSTSIHTVKYHLRNIYEKLGVINRTEAVAEARLIGLLS